MASHGARFQIHKQWFFQAVRATAYVAIPLCVCKEFFTFAQISGRSMQPTLNPPHDNHTTFWATRTPDWVLVNKWKPAVNARRGDVVCFVSKTNPRYLVRVSLCLEV